MGMVLHGVFLRPPRRGVPTPDPDPMGCLRGLAPSCERRRDRSSLERDNIDPERIKNDLVVGHYTNKDGKPGVFRGRECR